MLLTTDHRIFVLITIGLVALLVFIGAAPPIKSVQTLLPPSATPAKLTGNKPVNLMRVLPGVVKKPQSSGSGVAWSGGTETEVWCAELMQRLQVLPQRQNVGACVAWVRAEGTFMSINNPLNTTQEMPGASCYNRVCVKIYQSREDGFQATVTTFGYTGHGYEAILAAFQANDGDAAVQAIEVSDWGTGGLAAQVWSEIQGQYR